MTKLIVNIKDSADAKKISDALRLKDSVTDIKIEEKKSFAQAAAECNAVSLKAFDQMFAEEIRKAYSI